jgi:hypothetical protein
MASRPDSDSDESLTREQLEELRRNLSLLSPSSVMDFYRSAHRECAAERKPTARAIQQLVTSSELEVALRKFT